MEGLTAGQARSKECQCTGGGKDGATFPDPEEDNMHAQGFWGITHSTENEYFGMGAKCNSTIRMMLSTATDLWGE